jgi:asparagine synthase (glutamine-hydrolysing)
MSAFETAVGVPMGLGPEVVLPRVIGSPFAVLEEAVREAVHRPPCCVAFSGGRDSSLVLAAAARAAARWGCDPPVAVTLRFARDQSTDETHWQNLVLDHLGLDDQVVIELADELDFVGREAAEELRRRGARFPPNIHSLAPLLRHARDGCLVVGLGGDEVLGGYRWTQMNDVLARRRRPEPRDVARLALAGLPARMRARLRPRRGRLGPPRWLRPPAAREYKAITHATRDEPIRFDHAVRHAVRLRALRVGIESLARTSTKATVHAPLVDSRFIASLARAGGARGWGGRSAVMRAVAADVLPSSLLDRGDKAIFNAVFFGAASRRFAQRWSGGGLDNMLVDAEALRAEWLADKPDTRAALPLQVAWLNDQGCGADGRPLGASR